MSKTRRKHGRADCVKRIVHASGGTLTAQDARNFLDDLSKKVDDEAKTLGVDKELLVRDIVRKYKKEAQDKLVHKTREFLINSEVSDKFDTSINLLKMRGLSTKQALKAMLVGTEKNIAAGRLSISAQKLANQSFVLGNITSKLETEGLLPFVKNNSLDREVAKELWRLNSTPESAAKMVPSEHKEATRIAEIFNESLEYSRNRLNRAGALIGKVDGYMGRQTHDIGKLYAAGVYEWKEFMLNNLDGEKTFKNIKAEEKKKVRDEEMDDDEMEDKIDNYLDEIYTSLVSGVHLRPKAVPTPEDMLSPKDGNEFFKFVGPGNLAKRISGERKLFFKDADAAYEYNVKFGSGSFYSNLVSQLSTDARNIALMETLGTNPEAFLAARIRELRTSSRGDDPNAVFKEASSIMGLYKQVSGENDIPDYPTLANVGSFIRGMNQLTKLGGVVISSFSDLPVKALELQRQGFGVLESYGKTVSGLFAGRGPSERRSIAYALGTGYENMLGIVTSRFSSGESLPGMMTKALSVFYKINRMNWWNDVNKMSTSIDMSKRLGSFRRLEFNNLPKALKRDFARYSITSKDWDAIRKSSKRMNGEHYIVTDNNLTGPVETPPWDKQREALEAKKLFEANPEDKVLASSAKKLAEEASKLTIAWETEQAELAYKDKLRTKLQAYFSDRVNHAIIEPGDYERYLVTGGTKRGTALGETVRILTQFKSFPATYITRVIANHRYGSDSPVTMLVQLAVGATLAGYVSDTVSGALSGKTPRPVLDSRTLVASAARGGGFGILGDVMFTPYTYGKSFSQAMLGPTVSAVDDFMNLKTSAIKAVDNGEPADLAANSVKFVRNHLTPGQNLFYVKGALDYMFMYELQNWANPGYLRRMENKVKQNTGRDFFIKPSEAVK